MTPEKNSKEAQGVGTAQEQMLVKFNEARKSFHSYFDLDTIKETYELLIYGWTYSEDCDSTPQKERGEIYYFNRHLLEFLCEVAEEITDVVIFINYIDGWSYKTAKNRIFEVYNGFLCGEDANDTQTRVIATMIYNDLKDFLKEMFQIYNDYRASLNLPVPLL
jgi:hypothetical protein